MLKYFLLFFIVYSFEETTSNSFEDDNEDNQIIPSGSEGCAIYDKDNEKCTYCKSGYELKDGSCKICKPGYYSPGGNEKCKSCSSFGFCSKLTQLEGIEDDDFIDYTGKCPYFTYNEGSDTCEYCPIGRFVGLHVNDCIDCPDYCLECLGGHFLGTCIQCESGYGINDIGICEECSDNEYSDGFGPCKQIDGTENKELFIYNNEGYYEKQDIDGVTCGESEPGCVCVVNDQCYKKENITKHCIELKKIEETENKYKCSKCEEPYIIEKGICKPCPIGEHPNEDETTCLINMFGCIYQKGEICYDCDKDFILRNGKCILHDECDIIQESTCELCGEGKTLSTEGICTIQTNCKYTEDDNCLICESKYKIETNGDENSCIEYGNCLASNGEYCLKTIDGNKIKKETGEIISCEKGNNVCITPNEEDAKIDEDNKLSQIDFTCPENYYLPKGSKECKLKDTNSHCYTISNSDCVKCNDGYYLIDGDCQKVMEGCKIAMPIIKEEGNENKNENEKELYCLVCGSTNNIWYQGQCWNSTGLGIKLNCQGGEYKANENGAEKCQCLTTQALDTNGCVDVPLGCNKYGYALGQCLECNEYGLFGKCYFCEEGYIMDGMCFQPGELVNKEDEPIEEESSYEPTEEDKEKTPIEGEETRKREKQNLKEEEIDSKLCYTFTKTGCLRCIEGYYLKNGKCLQCPINECTVCSENEETKKVECHSCTTGYTLKKGEENEEDKCEADAELIKKCETLMPNGGCAICKDKYYRNEQNCYDCDESCSICSNEESCTSCASNYFRDDISLSETNLCLPYSNLTHCSLKTPNGCQKCENKYYLEQTRCKECSSNCTKCSSEEECNECSIDYVHIDSTIRKCIYYKDISHCLSAKQENGEYKCGSCEEGYRINGYKCEKEPPNYALLIGAPAAGVLVLLIIIVIIVLLIIFIVQHKKEKKKQEDNMTIFEIKHSNISMQVLDDNIVSNKNELDFNEEEGELEVDKESKILVCIGYTGKGRVKMQMTTKENKYKYEINVEPGVVILKQGQACEFSINVIPLCSTDLEDIIILNVLNISNGNSKQISIPIKYQTELTTKLDPEELIEDKKLGEGSFGIVFLGTFRGNKVAIKKMKTQESFSKAEEMLKEFTKEVEMLDKFRNDYVVHFYGAVFIPEKICMVTEFAEYGSINDLMNKRKEEPISNRMKIKVMLDSAKGIKYLHDNGILHRDIKPDNFLVTSLEDNIQVNAKLTDFGASRNINMLMTNLTFTKGIGTPKYMAPEVLDRQHYKKEADIYSFAITMFEILIWGDAYPKSEFKYPWKIADFVTGGKRLQQQEPITDEQYELLQKCWCQDPKGRFSIDEVVAYLVELYEKE